VEQWRSLCLIEQMRTGAQPLFLRKQAGNCFNLNKVFRFHWLSVSYF
jgi:hypothetical protein